MVWSVDLSLKIILQALKVFILFFVSIFTIFDFSIRKAYVDRPKEDKSNSQINVI